MPVHFFQTRRWKPGAALAVALCTPLLPACTEPPPDSLQGYAEAEYVRVAAPLSGRLLTLAVSRGDGIEAGVPLFVLEQESEAAARQEAERRVEKAKSQLADLGKGRRPDEIAAIEAQRREAQAALELARAQLGRQERLVAQGFISRDRLDEARTAAEQARQRVGELEAQLRVARLPARSDAIQAARAEVDAAEAALAQAEWRLTEKSVNAPVAGLVHDTLYRPGEWVPAGSPVVSLLPPGNIKLRFFVPEPRLAQVKRGQSVDVSCDGCGASFAATVRYVSPQAEYTPPVIYSRDVRAKLVFLVEAWPAPADAQRLHPGQPVDVRLTGQ